MTSTGPPPATDAIAADWHSLPMEDVLARLGTDAGGLATDEARARLIGYGANLLPEPKRRSLLAIVASQLLSPFIYLLVAAGSVSAIMGDVTDAAFIFLVLAINTAIGATQEAGAEGSTAALRRSVRTACRVMRDGATIKLDAEALVPGDVVVLEAGDKVPADLRVLAASELSADESALTGESMPEDKAADGALPPPSTPLADRINMLWSGTLLRGGRAEAVVVATGRATAFGKLASAMQLPSAAPPLVARLNRFTRMLGMGTILVVIAIIALRLAAGAGLRETVLVAVALAISVIPEGLPVAVTVALSVATSRMAKRHVIVRNLPAVEGLGACTVIATDKTGTLTVNQLTAKQVWLPERGMIAVGGEGLDPTGAFILPDGSAAEIGVSLASLSRSATLVNDASYDPDDSSTEASGDPLDVALLVMAAKSAIRIDDLRRDAPRIDAIPFSAERRYAATLNLHGDEQHLHVKGAPEVIIPLCTGIDCDAVLHQAEAMAAGGFRVLSVAVRQLSPVDGPSIGDGLNGLTLLGLVGFIDPLRPEAAEAVAACHRAGVAVKMITGDHPATALAIARQLGLASSAGDVATGTDLERAAAGDTTALARIQNALVFARVEPAQKVEIVDILRRAGDFVAMTGDGVNDAPALRRADIGIAMGRDGTDAARDAADLILADDNFASIVAGIEEGRAAYANIRKVIFLLVSTGFAEAAMFLLALFTGLPLPLTAVQLLWLNLVTNGGQDVALAFEAREPDLLGRPPRRPAEALFDALLIRQTLVSGIYIGIVSYLVFAFCLSRGMPEAEARNVVLFLLVLFENIQALSARSETRSVFHMPLSGNWILIAAIAGAQTIQFAAPFIPWVKDVLEVQPMPPGTWSLLLAIGVSLLAVTEIERLLRTGSQRWRPRRAD